MVVFKLMIIHRMVRTIRLLFKQKMQFRQNADNLNMLAVRNSKGQMVSIANYITKDKTGQPLHPSRVSIMLWPLQIGGSASSRICFW